MALTNTYYPSVLEQLITTVVSLEWLEEIEILKEEVNLTISLKELNAYANK